MSEFDTYLLVHPERFPTNDTWAICEDPEIGTDTHGPMSVPGGFDAAYGHQVQLAAARADRRVVILDPYDVDALAEEAEDLDGVGTLPQLGEGGLLEALAQTAATPLGEQTLKLTEGVPAAGWDLHQADAFNVARVAGRLGLEGRVLVGGFARRDCVARVALALRRRGLQVEVCDLTCLPLRADAAVSYPAAPVAA